MNSQMPHVVIVGGGFAGLYAAKALRKAEVRVTVVDSRNHHVFQPLLYQVATASLSPAQIAAPIRKILAQHPRAEVLLGEVTSIDLPARRVVLRDGQVDYDYLILAAGMTHTYFGHDEWAAFAPGLKNIEDALEIRRRFLLAFEAAERETDPIAKRASMTFVIVGGGPTGVELAGAIAEVARHDVPDEFRHIDTKSARIVLIEGGPRILASFSPALSARARRDLESLGVEVRVNQRVSRIDARGVEIGSERLDAGCVIWAAGVKPSPLAATLGVPLDRGGHVLVEPDLSLPGHPEAFVAGDLASVRDRVRDMPVPGVAPAAMQMGTFAAKIVASEVKARAAGRGAPPRPVFKYLNKGELATIGRARAVGVLGFGLNLEYAGLVAWLFWALIHIAYLIGFRSRLTTMIDWITQYVVFDRGVRLITGDATLHLRTGADRITPPASNG